MKKNGFFTFCFSFIPGAGQMYQGYMKRGVSIMVIFAIFVALLAIVSTPIFMIPLPIIFAYSFFDTYNIRNRIGTPSETADEYIWNNFKSEKLGIDFKSNKKNKVIGIVMLLVGIYILLNNILVDVSYRLNIDWLVDLIRFIIRYAPPMAIALFSIWYGVRLINKK